MNLHNLLGNDLDFFVCLSSTVALTGNIGQCNYGAACSFQDALVRYRNSVGLPAFSINLGPVMEAGYVSENPEVIKALRRQGLGSVSVSELLALLNYAVTKPHSGSEDEHVCSLGLVATGDDVDFSESIWMKDCRFAHLIRHSKETGKKTARASFDVPQLLSNAIRFEDAVEIICKAILQQLGRLIATPVEMLSPSKNLDSYGVDSLVAVELRNWLNAYLQANVQLLVLRSISTIHKLAELVAKESHLVNIKALEGKE